jgi:RimJ/RimL family protein N-acetyltransferase
MNENQPHPTGTLRLRPVKDEDMDTLFAYERDPQAVHMAAFTPKNPDDRAAFDAHWQRNLANKDNIVRVIEYDGQPAGSIAYFVMFDEPSVTYWVGREFWGKGIATRALQAFLKEVDVRPLYARAAKDNLASQRVLEKCGFVACGEEKGFANARGAEIDEVLFVLADEKAED